MEFVANTGLVYHNNKLLALYEADKPCEFAQTFPKHFKSVVDYLDYCSSGGIWYAN